MITNKKGRCFDFSSNSLNNILKKLYEDHSGEFCCGCWLLVSSIGWVQRAKQVVSNSPGLANSVLNLPKGQ